MAPPTFSISMMWFESPTYKENPELLSKFVKGSRGSEGNIRTYTGFQTEHENTGLWLSLWKTLEAHEAFVAAHPDFSEVAKLTGPPKVTYATTEDSLEDLYKLLDAPATEIVEIKLKPEHDDKQAELNELMDKLIAGLKVAEGNLGASKGKSVHDGRMYVHIIGWTSVQAHWDAVKEGTPLGDTIKEFLVIADIQFIKHATLSSK